MKERWSQVCGLGNWIDGAAILSEGTQGRERFREVIRFGEVSFGPIGVKVLMGDPSGDIFMQVAANRCGGWLLTVRAAAAAS